MRNTDRCNRIGWLAIAALLGAAVPALVQASFTGLGDFAGGSFNSQAFAVTADGSVVVGSGSTSNCGLAFRWTAGGGMVSLGDLPGGNCRSIARAVSSDGLTIVGESNSTSGIEAFRWTQADGMVSLGDFPGGLVSSRANGISGDGSIVVGFGTTSTIVGFVWTSAGGMVSLGHLPGGGVFSRADGISADGSVVVGTSTSVGGDGSDFEAFRWTQAGGMVGIGDLPGGVFRSEAFAVSADGSVIVGGSFSGNSEPFFTNEAFRWTAATGMVGLGDLPGLDFFSEALAVSADGSVVVGRSQGTAGPNEAFIWDVVNGMRRLQSVLVNDYGLDLTGFVLRGCVRRSLFADNSGNLGKEAHLWQGLPIPAI